MVHAVYAAMCVTELPASGATHQLTQADADKYLQAGAALQKDHVKPATQKAVKELQQWLECEAEEHSHLPAT